MFDRILDVTARIVSRVTFLEISRGRTAECGQSVTVIRL